MKRIKMRLVVVALFACGFCACTTTANAAGVEHEADRSANDSLSISLYTDTSAYLYGQNIIARAVIRNVTTRTLSVKDTFYPAYALAILDQRGEKLSDRGSFPLWGEIPPRQLLPGDSMSSSCYLCEDYAFSRHKSVSDCLSVGDVTIYASYVNQLFSENVTLHILAPAGRDALAFDLLKQSRATMAGRDVPGGLVIIDSLIRAYPESPYLMEAAKFGLLIAVMQHDSLRIHSYGRELIKQGPDRGYAISGLDNILAIIPFEDRAHVCDSISSVLDGTRIADYARPQVREAERKR